MFDYIYSSFGLYNVVFGSEIIIEEISWERAKELTRQLNELLEKFN